MRRRRCCENTWNRQPTTPRNALLRADSLQPRATYNRKQRANSRVQAADEEAEEEEEGEGEDDVECARLEYPRVPL